MRNAPSQVSPFLRLAITATVVRFSGAALAFCFVTILGLNLLPAELGSFFTVLALGNVLSGLVRLPFETLVFNLASNSDYKKKFEVEKLLSGIVFIILLSGLLVFCLSRIIDYKGPIAAIVVYAVLHSIVYISAEIYKGLENIVFGEFLKTSLVNILQIIAIVAIGSSLSASDQVLWIINASLAICLLILFWKLSFISNFSLDFLGKKFLADLMKLFGKNENSGSNSVAYGIFSIALQNSPVLSLGFLGKDEEAGLFGLAQRVMFVFQIPLLMIQQTVWQKFSGGQGASFLRHASKLFFGVAFLGLLVSIIAMGFGKIYLGLITPDFHNELFYFGMVAYLSGFYVLSLPNFIIANLAFNGFYICVLIFGSLIMISGSIVVAKNSDATSLLFLSGSFFTLYGFIFWRFLVRNSEALR